MTVQNVSFSSDTKINQNYAVQIRSYIAEYKEYKKIEQKFQEFLKNAPETVNQLTKEEIKLISGPDIQDKEHTFGKRECFRLARRTLKLKIKDQTSYQEIFSQGDSVQIMVQKACSEYETDRKIMKSALTTILNFYRKRKDVQEQARVNINELLTNLKSDENQIDFGRILSSLEGLLMRRKTSNPNILSRTISIMKIHSKEKDSNEHPLESPSTHVPVFLEPPRSPSAGRRSPRARQSEIQHKRSDSRSEVDQTSSVKPKDRFEEKIIDDKPMTVESLESFLKTMAFNFQVGIPNPNVYASICTILINLPEQTSVKEIFSMHANLYRDFMKLYMKAKFIYWILNEEQYQALIERFKQIVLNLMVPDPLLLEEHPKETHLMALFNESEYHIMLRHIDMLSDPFHTYQENFQKHQPSSDFVPPETILQGLMKSMILIQNHHVFLIQCLKEFYDCVVDQKHLKTFFVEILENGTTRLQTFERFLQRPLIHFHEILKLFEQ